MIDELTRLRESLNRWTPNFAETAAILDTLEITVFLTRKAVSEDWEARNVHS
jgi:hypothetical protein